MHRAAGVLRSSSRSVFGMPVSLCGRVTGRAGRGCYGGRGLEIRLQALYSLATRDETGFSSWAILGSPGPFTAPSPHQHAERLGRTLPDRARHRPSSSAQDGQRRFILLERRPQVFVTDIEPNRLLDGDASLAPYSNSPAASAASAPSSPSPRAHSTRRSSGSGAMSSRPTRGPSL